MKRRRNLPWLTRDIKKGMRRRKHLYNHAKQTNSPTHWNTYRKIRNLINKTLGIAHTAYQSRLFDNSFAGNRRQFWKYIRSKRKEKCGISSLSVDSKEYSNPKDKAIILNNYFQSVFTNEDLSTVPSTPNHVLPTMSPISLSTTGIESLLSNLDPNKAPGPDHLSSYILKHCAHKIAPILEIIFDQSLNTSNLPMDWLTANITPVFQKRCT